MEIDLFKDIIITDLLTKFNIIFYDGSKIEVDKNNQCLNISKEGFYIKLYGESTKIILSKKYSDVKLIEVIE